MLINEEIQKCKEIMEFDKEYNAEVVHMNTNYRSVGSIIDLANKFAETMEDSKHRNYKPVIAFKDKGNLPKFKIYDSDKDEAETIADEIKHDIVYFDIFLFEIIYIYGFTSIIYFWNFYFIIIDIAGILVI